MKKVLLSLAGCFIAIPFLYSQQYTPAQQLVLRTNEDSLNAGVATNKTVVSGYGSAFYQRNFNEEMSRATLERAVLFIGHRFNDKISFFSEMELENTVVEAGSDSKDNFKGELAMEQAYLRFNLNPRQYIVAGLFTPRIGMLNENHLPVNFNGVERPLVEQLIIPATWRELGIGFYGRLRRQPLNYSIALLNGLSAASFEHGTGIIEGRAEGSGAFANDIAITASLQYYWQNFRFQVSGYMGGTNGANKRQSDSLQLHHGAFGLPLYLGEANIQYTHNGFAFKAIGSIISYPNAADINKAYANNVSKVMYGAYAELAYNLLEKSVKYKEQQLNAFARYEVFDLNSSIPNNGIYDGTLKQQHLIAGFTYLPILNVAIKADVRLAHTGDENPVLVINPSPARIPYKTNNTFLNVGIGYAF
ncbi:hypothetical protein SAMN04488505_107123 [Chitinophaga rupis]|uniref:Phosphate-selective porin O and P n=1 Tax=Chitinophaga rupis TaxID=573321 RepID=A0A1H8CHA9_9BACT|nr:hypothetical protein [Chitinophaga rupis]SEM94671.1 hypothetical protein SAMN04488505_107123 [Chitinophaga rupis]